MTCVEHITERNELIHQLDRFVGMPTMEYDEIIDATYKKIIEIEKQLVKTCEGCGGEILPSGVESLHYEPSNGLCAKELSSCNILEINDAENDEVLLVVPTSVFDEMQAKLEQRINDLESQLAIAFEIMTEKQIRENIHLFQEQFDIVDSDREEQRGE